jgi:glutamine amidotransferase
MSVAIIDYGSGNLRSAAKAFERVVLERGSGNRILVTDKAEDVAAAERVVLPGVGAFADCRRGVADVDGMEAALREAVIDRGRPFLGICVGMQLMANEGRENVVTPGFGWLDGVVDRLQPDREEDGRARKVPHMGWNQICVRTPHPVLASMDEEPYLYFVHGYHFRANDPDVVLAETDYGGSVAAVVGRDNMIGTQFHPEKSQRAGMQLIDGFLGWRP